MKGVVEDAEGFLVLPAVEEPETAEKKEYKSDIDMFEDRVRNIEEGLAYCFDEDVATEAKEVYRTLLELYPKDELSKLGSEERDRCEVLIGRAKYLSDYSDIFGDIFNYTSTLNFLKEDITDVSPDELDKRAKIAGRMAKYSTVMDIGPESMRFKDYEERMSNRMRLQAKIAALRALKLDAKLGGHAKRSKYVGMLHTRHKDIVYNICREARDSEDYELICHLRGIVGKEYYDKAIAVSRPLPVEEPEPEPQKRGWFKSHLGKAAAFVAGFALGTLGIQNYHEPETQKDTPVVVSAAKKEAKPEYELKLDFGIGASPAKYSKELTLELIPEPEYSIFGLDPHENSKRYGISDIFGYPSDSQPVSARTSQ